MEGKGLADTLHVQGNEVFQNAFRNPPQTTQAILLPARTKTPPPLKMPDMPEESYLSETAGQLGLRLWLEPMGDAGAALEISSCWENDRFLLIPDGEASAAVIWDIELESKEAADQLQAAALDRIAVMADLKESAEFGKVIITADKRHLRITRPSVNRVRFLNTATPELAAKFNS
jgi:hypothetical protein